MPGNDRAIAYLVNRTQVPNLTQAQVSVRLNEPGSQQEDRVNQLDLSVSKVFRARGMRLTPQVDLFNILNVNPVTQQINTFGSSLGNVQAVLDPRLIRVGLQMAF